MSRIAKVIESYGADSNGKLVAKYHFECDTISDLPTVAEATASNIVMVLGSDAHIIQDDTKYMIKGDGVWVKQKGEFELSLDAAAIDYDNTTSGMTATNVQDAIDKLNTDLSELTALTDEDRNALVEQVDGGAKSLLPIGVSSITYANAVTFTVASDGQITVNGTNPNAYAGIPYTDLVTAKSAQTDTRYTLPAGKYKITATGSGLKFQVHCHNGTTTQQLFSGKGGGEFEYTEALKSTYPYICWRLAIDAGASFSNQVVKPMICTAADWAISQKFVPYAPTNRELYEMILQLQSAAGLRTVSTLRSAAAPLENEIEEEVTEDEER